MKIVQVLLNFCQTVLKKIKNQKLKTLIFVSIGLFILKITVSRRKPLPMVEISKFLAMLNSGEIVEVLIKPNYIIFMDKMKNILKSNHSLMPKQILFNIISKAQITFSYAGSHSFNIFFIISIFFTVFSLSYLYFSMNEENNNNKIPHKRVLFTDIIGLQQPKKALQEVIQFMGNSSKFQKLGARMRKGIILYGPPGTGKTTLAKACANEAGVQFFACNASQFCEIYVGAGPKKVRQLFKRAKQLAPSIIFIDEIDAIGNRRGKMQYESSADSQRNSTINQLLSQMDGFNSHDSVLVIAATNKLQLIDKSLLRPGRFDLKIQISLPNIIERKQILYYNLKLKNNNLDQNFIQQLSQNMIGWSGADIQNLTNQSVYHALRRNSDTIEKQDITKCFKNLQIF